MLMATSYIYIISYYIASPNFVGALPDETEQEVTPCPEECRPKQHKDWTTC
jgi:hypothetical protein